jgi:SAGA-associated factor 29
MKRQEDAGTSTTPSCPAENLLTPTEPSIEDLDALSALYRESVRIAENSKSLLDSEDLLMKVQLLHALVSHSERNIAPTTNGLSALRDSRSNTDFDRALDSSVLSLVDNKHVRKVGTSRTSSQLLREREVAKDELEERETNPGRTKITFALGAEVAFKPKIPGQAKKHDWIQGIVVKVIGEGKSRRYNVQDPFPDDASRPGETYRSSASSMVKIPPVGTPLADYEVRKRVLALYPETTTFYRADVKGMLDDGAKVQLLFEEENAGALKIVDRRFVLDHKG